MARKRKATAPAQATHAGDRIIFDISIAEARTLMVMMMKVGGCPQFSPRKHMDAIRAALIKADPTLDLASSLSWIADPARYGTGFWFVQGNIALDWPDNTAPTKVV